MTSSTPHNEATRYATRFPRARRYAPWLCVALGLFCLRVLGQLLVAAFDVGFLPPMEAWYSGLIPYPPLLMSQLVIIGLFGTVCWQFIQGRGWFVRARARLGASLMIFGSVYLTAMILRYVVRMSLYPSERWLGGSIPILFHWVLAGFVLLLGHYHRGAEPTEAS